MPKRCLGFAVKSTVRPSGTSCWIVSGSLAGRQVRREFSDRHEALVWAEQQNSLLRGAAANEAPVLTHLSADRVREAEAIFGQLEVGAGPQARLLDIWNFYRDYAPLLSTDDVGRLRSSLALLRKKFPDVTPSKAIAWFVENYRAPQDSVTLHIALENYLADVARRYEGQTLSYRQWMSVGREFARVELHFGSETPLTRLDHLSLQSYLRDTAGDHYSNKTWNNRRGYLTAFFNFCRQEGWADRNPAEALRSYRKKELPHKTPKILHLEQVRTLMAGVEQAASGRLVPYFVLCLFCGIRPDWKDGEMDRIRPDDLKIGDRKIKLRADQTKTKKARETVLQPNVLEWLRAYPLEQFPLRAVNHRKLLKKIRVQFELGHDVLRHTYCSMLVGKFRSVGDASLQAGNSEDIIWADYLDLVDQNEANAFWEIRPTRAPALLTENPIA